MPNQSEREQLSILGILSGDPAMQAVGELMLKEEYRRTGPGRKMNVGMGLMYDANTGETITVPGYDEAAAAKRTAEQDVYRQQLEMQLQKQNDASLYSAQVGQQYAKPPAGYQWDQQGGQTFVPGGPHDPARPQRPTAEETRKSGQADAAETMLDRMEELYKTGKVDVGQISGWMTQQAGAEGPVGYVASKFENMTDEEAEMLSLQEASGNLLIAAFRGAQVGPAEQIKFEKQLPRLGQPKELFEKNLILTRQNLAFIRKAKQEQRPTSGGVTGPQKRTRVVNGITYEEVAPDTWLPK